MSLKILLVCLIGVSIWSAWICARWYREGKAITAIQAHRGAITYRSNFDSAGLQVVDATLDREFFVSQHS